MMIRFWCLLVFLTVLTAPAFCQQTAFVYQGSLEVGGVAADGEFDFTFALFDDPVSGTLLGTVELTDVPVDNGVFQTTLDFGSSVFSSGDPRWLEIKLRGSGTGDSFQGLLPRTEITSTPYAVRSLSADDAETAGFAFDGPFVREDASPTASGLRTSTIETVMVQTGSFGVLNGFRLDAPVEISRDVIACPVDGLFLGLLQRTSVRLWRPTAPTDGLAAQLFNGFGGNGLGGVDIEIKVESANIGEVQYNFQNGTFEGYELAEGTNGGSIEIIRIEFLASGVTRAFTPDPSGISPSIPLQGDQVFGPGSGTGYQAIFWDRGVPSASSASVLPVLERLGPAVQPVEFLRSVLTENDTWADFVLGRVLPSAVIQEPGGTTLLELSNLSAISKWSLRRAPDGGLYEAYEVKFRVTP